MNTAESVKAKLRNRAKSDQRSYEEILMVYGLERMLYRLSISPHSNYFVLKGGILLYAIYEGKFMRGTADVDLLGEGIQNSIMEVEAMFRKIFAIVCPDDGILFDTNTLTVRQTSELKSNPGISIGIDGFLNKTKIRVNIDVGFGDVIFPGKTMMEYPTLLESYPSPVLQVYSIESVISEKFEAIVSLGRLNSRMKDFYDIFALSKTRKISGFNLQKAIFETFMNRNTKFDEIAAFDETFCSDKTKTVQWKVFLKTKKIEFEYDFCDVVNHLKHFFLPILDSIASSHSLKANWNFETNEWERCDQQTE